MLIQVQRLILRWLGGNMGTVVINGSTSGSCTLHPTDISGSTVLTLPTTPATFPTVPTATWGN